MLPELETISKPGGRIAEWSSWSAHLAHNQEAVGSNPTSATNQG